MNIDAFLIDNISKYLSNRFNSRDIKFSTDEELLPWAKRSSRRRSRRSAVIKLELPSGHTVTISFPDVPVNKGNELVSVDGILKYTYNMYISNSGNDKISKLAYSISITTNPDTKDTNYTSHVRLETLYNRVNKHLVGQFGSLKNRIFEEIPKAMDLDRLRKQEAEFQANYEDFCVKYYRGVHDILSILGFQRNNQVEGIGEVYDASFDIGSLVITYANKISWTDGVMTIRPRIDFDSSTGDISTYFISSIFMDKIDSTNTLMRMLWETRR